jgi:hypothetical protein
MARPPKPVDRPASPRRRNRLKKQDNTQQIETIEINETRLSSDIPDEIKIAFAEAIMMYAAMEHIAERLIWDITGLTYDDGRLLTRLDAQPKFDLLRSLIEQHGHVVHYNRRTATEMWGAIKTLIPVRNLAIHGVWAMLDGKTPIAISPRLPTTPGQVVGEPLRLERLRAMAGQCHRVKEILSALLDRVRASTGHG